MENYAFVKAVDADIDAVYELIRKRIKWMDESDIYQWNKTAYLELYPKEYFRQKAKVGELYVLKDLISNRVLGAVVLLEEDERWKPDGSNSYYVHNLVSDTEMPGVGRKIMDFCESMALRHGKDRMRLDCQASNIRLNRFYEELGYKFVGVVDEGNYVGNKREKII